MVQRLPVRLRLLVGIAVLVAMVLVGTTAGPKPGDAEPGEAPKPTNPAPAVWTEADKDGFGTSTTEGSKVWYTIDDGQLTEVYYPDIGTPSVRNLQFIVSDGKTFAELETEATNHQVQLLGDERALVYRQINTDKSGDYRITKTYVTDPARSTVLVDVNFESLSRKPYQLYAIYDPSLDNGGTDDSATSEGARLLASDVDAASEGGDVASALVGSPGFAQVSSGHLGASDGWTDLKEDYKMDWDYRSASNGNVVQTAKTTLSGLPNSQRLTLSLGFGSNTSEALQGTQTSLKSGFQTVQTNYQTGWHDYLGSLEDRPNSVSGSALLRTTYDVSAMMMRAHEDKTYHGASIASPSMPWVWGGVGANGNSLLDNRGADDSSGAYHLVWARDLYQAATTMLAMGDEDGAERALDYLFEEQQKDDGSFPQNSYVDGTPRWENTQLDEVSFPLILAWQLGSDDPETYQDHVKPAADYIVDNGPDTPQERWENQGGYSPATIAAEIAGLVSAAEIARINGDQASAETYLATADEWQDKVEDWTVTTNGPLANHPYYLRITKDPIPDNGIEDLPDPNAGTTYNIGDSGPNNVDQRRVVDTSYLELVRLGVKPPNDPTSYIRSMWWTQRRCLTTRRSGSRWIRQTAPSGTASTSTATARREMVSRGTSGLPRATSPPASRRRTRSGERGPSSPESAASTYLPQIGRAPKATSRLWRNTGNDGYMLPEQVWDENLPSGQPGFPRGEGTFSATPLAWSHAQFIRLAWSIDAGHPVEQPKIVYDRYVAGASQAGG